MSAPKTKTKPVARAGLKWLAQRFVDTEMRDARCRSHPELPWTADCQPARPVLLRMQECCAGCPVLARCEQMGVDALGGMYAGVWLPWKDEKGFPGIRTARNALRARVAARGDCSMLAPAAVAR